MLCGAEEACWAHNPKVLGSKPSGANFGFIGCFLALPVTNLLHTIYFTSLLTILKNN